MNLPASANLRLHPASFGLHEGQFLDQFRGVEGADRLDQPIDFPLQVRSPLLQPLHVAAVGLGFGLELLLDLLDQGVPARPQVDFLEFVDQPAENPLGVDGVPAASRVARAVALA